MPMRHVGSDKSKALGWNAVAPKLSTLLVNALRELLLAQAAGRGTLEGRLLLACLGLAYIEHRSDRTQAPEILLDRLARLFENANDAERFRFLIDDAFAEAFSGLPPDVPPPQAGANESAAPSPPQDDVGKSLGGGIQPIEPGPSATDEQQNEGQIVQPSQDPPDAHQANLSKPTTSQDRSGQGGEMANGYVQELPLPANLQAILDASPQSVVQLDAYFEASITQEWSGSNPTLQFARSVYYDSPDPGSNVGSLSRVTYRDVGYFSAEMRMLRSSLSR